MNRSYSTSNRHIIELIEINEDGDCEDFRIIHPDSCSTETVYIPPTTFIEYTCQVGITIMCDGLYAFSEGLPDKPGRYEIEALEYTCNIPGSVLEWQQSSLAVIPGNKR
jgi:hypothetical protein